MREIFNLLSSSKCVKGLANCRYQLNNGLLRKEEGELHTDGDSSFYRVKGFYSFVAAGVRRVNVIYTADEHGYKAKVIDKLSNITRKSINRVSSAVIKTLIGG